MIKFEGFLADKLEQFLAYRKETGYIHGNIRWFLSVFDNYVKTRNAGLGDMTPGFFLEFRLHVPGEPGTTNRVLLHLRNFFDYLVRIEHIAQNPLTDIPPLTENSYVPFMFSPDQLESFLQLFRKNMNKKSEQKFLKDLAAYTVFLLMARCGLRISEPLKLRDAHFRSDERTIYIEKTKFNKDRLIPITSEVTQGLQNYISVRKSILGRMTDPIILTTHHGPISKNLIYKRFHPAVEGIGINHPKRIIGGITFGHPRPHSFRHSFAVNTLKKACQKGRSPENVLPILAAYLGHTDYRYTIKYLKVMDSEHLNQWVNFCVFKERTLKFWD